MTSKKDFVIAVLATFCLTATLFMVIPVNSASVWPYDPWLDYNDDGKIDLKDVYAMQKTYGATGDPTKNVNITNWQSKCKISVYDSINFTWEDYGSIQGYPIMEGFAGGYSKMSIQVVVENCSEGFGWISILANSIVWLIQKPSGPFGVPCEPVYDPANVTFLMDSGTTYSKCTDVSGINEIHAPYYQLQLYARTEVEHGWLLLSVYAYLRNN